MSNITLVADSPTNLQTQIVRILDEQDGLITITRPDKHKYVLTAAGAIQGSYVIVEKVTTSDIAPAKTMSIGLYQPHRLAEWLADYQATTWRVEITA